jgi:translation initiation factor 1
MPRDENRTVYSTDPNFSKRCPRCGKLLSLCLGRCPKPKSLPPEQQTAAIRREVKGRGGKTVTVIRDLQLSPEDLAALAKTLKQACGSGGTVKGGNIEIQGDHREKIAARLRSMGYKTKFVGG